MVLRAILMLGSLFMIVLGLILTAPLIYLIFMLLVGLLGIYSAVNERYAYYQIDAPDLGVADRKRWRLDRKRWGAGKLEKFAETVKERMDSANA